MRPQVELRLRPIREQESDGQTRVGATHECFVMCYNPLRNQYILISKVSSLLLIYLPIS